MRSIITDILPENDNNNNNNNNIIINDNNNNNNIILSTLFLGANDAVDSNAQQHVPVDEYKENLIYIIKHLQKINPDMVIIIITPPIVDNSKWNTRNIDNVTKYANVVREISNEFSVSLCDLWINPAIELNDLNDGLHFGPIANEKVLNNIIDIITTKYPHILPEDTNNNTGSLSMHYPHFLEIAGKSPNESNEILKNWKWN